MFDQEPVIALAAVAVMAHANQNPATLQLLTCERKLELALAQGLVGVALVGSPEPAIPQHDCAAAVFSLGDRPFKIAVVERMILNLDGEALVAGIEGRPFGDRP